MIRKYCAPVLCLSLCLAACGGSGAPAKSADDVDEAAESDESADASGSDAGETESDPPDDESASASLDMPTKCAGKGSVCVPPRKFVEVLCNGSYPDAAIWLLSTETPFTRGYLRGETDAWNAAGGASDTSEKMSFDEEVLILRERSADLGGMQVSGAGGGYDALRWDGSCVSLAKEEVTLDRPPRPRSAQIDWRYLGSETQEALRKDDTVTEIYRARRQECKGAVSGSVSKKCVKLTAKLSRTVADYVRNGGKVPKPAALEE